MELSAINGLAPLTNTNTNQSLKNKDDNTFQDMLKDAISEVNDSQVKGYNAMEGIATGEVKNLQEAVQKIEEAELSLKLALEVKNKAVGAYKEIMRMSV